MTARGYATPATVSPCPERRVLWFAVLAFAFTWTPGTVASNAIELRTDH